MKEYTQGLIKRLQKALPQNKELAREVSHFLTDIRKEWQDSRPTTPPPQSNASLIEKITREAQAKADREVEKRRQELEADIEADRAKLLERCEVCKSAHDEVESRMVEELTKDQQRFRDFYENINMVFGSLGEKIEVWCNGPDPNIAEMNEILVLMTQFFGDKAATNVFTTSRGKNVCWYLIKDKLLIVVVDPKLVAISKYGRAEIKRLSKILDDLI